jgi:hypothetical protein
MRVSTVREFRDKATVLLKSKEPILITRRGRMAGIFFLSPEGTVSLDLNRQLFDRLKRGDRATASEEWKLRRRDPIEF